ncbi:MAG: hypothetical protein RR192_02410 [Peptostreptococcaceae bacterium]
MFDFGITENGELLFDNENMDALKKDKDELIKQIAISRIKSVTKDWFNSNIGANLEEFIGTECTEETSNDVINAIIISLTFDQFLKTGSLFFVPKIDKNSISILVFIKKYYGEGPMIINVEIDIVGGVKVEYDTDS